MLLMAALLLGLAHVALLPPFEGMDETAHYSSIVQIADTGTLPRLGDARMAREVEDYRARGPMPYVPTPPFEANGGLTYRSFFAGQPEAVADPPSPPFAAASEANWQAQHPPLYYLLMAPLARATAGAPLRQRLLVLRSASYLLAFAGLCLAALAGRRLLPGGAMAAALWPLVVPSWFPEMARLGNDSLAALLIAAAWAGLLAIMDGKRGIAPWIVVGIALGLGCLTKAFVVPMALSCMMLLAWLSWRRRRLPPFLLCLSLALGMAAPWYWWQAANGIGLTNDGMLLASQGGLLAGLAAHGSVMGLAHSLASFAKSFLWAGTWSLGRPPPMFYLPLGAFWLLVLGAWAATLRRETMRALLPLVFVLPLLAGLVLHSLIWLAIDGSSGVTGGWYLHVLVGPLSVILALAAGRLARPTVPRHALLGLGGYAVAFAVATAWLQLALFAGCVHRSGEVNHYRAAEGCLFDPMLLFARLDLLAYPHAAMAAAGFGLLALGAAMAVSIKPPGPGRL